MLIKVAAKGISVAGTVPRGLAPNPRTMNPDEMTILACPQCFSHRAQILNNRPPKARCADCSHVYPIHTLDVQPVPDDPAPPFGCRRRPTKT
jgi:hypothetical protein